MYRLIHYLIEHYMILEVIIYVVGYRLVRNKLRT